MEENKQSNQPFIFLKNPLITGEYFRMSLKYDNLFIAKNFDGISKYINGDYSPLFHYKGIFYPFSSERFPKVDDIEVFILKNGSYYLKMFLLILIDIDKLLQTNNENVNNEKLENCKEAKTRTTDFIFNILSEIVLDVSPVVFKAIPLQLRGRMIKKYIDQKMLELTSDNPFPVKKHRTPYSFSSFFDKYLLHQYMMSLHNRCKKTIEEFLSKMFQNDPYYRNIVREAATIYRQVYPEQKSQVAVSQEQPSISAVSVNSVVSVINISVRNSTVSETEKKAISPSVTNVLATLSNDEDSETVLDEGFVSKDSSIKHGLRSPMDGDSESSRDAKRKSTDESSISNSGKKKQKK